MSDIEWNRFLEETRRAAKYANWRRLTRLFNRDGSNAPKRIAAAFGKCLLRDKHL